MANITITNFRTNIRLYGVELVSGDNYTQSGTPEFLALLDAIPTDNGTFSGTIIADTTPISQYNTDIDIEIQLTPTQLGTISAILTTDSSLTEEETCMIQAFCEYLDDISFTEQMKKVKDQEGNIYECGISGDIAGLLISKLNKLEFNDVQDDEILIDSLSIEEIENYKSYITNLKNVIVRKGKGFRLQGNMCIQSDYSSILSRLNVKLLSIYIGKSLTKYFEILLSKNINKIFMKDINLKVQQILKPVRQYFNDLTYEIEADRNKRVIFINIKENYKDLVKRLKINVSKEEIK